MQIFAQGGVHTYAPGFIGSDRWDMSGEQAGAHLHWFVYKIEECVLVNKCKETGVINYRCGNVVWGNAVTVTRGNARERCWEEGEGGFPHIPSTNTNLNCERRERRLIKHDKGRTFTVNPSTVVADGLLKLKAKVYMKNLFSSKVYIHLNIS